MSEEMARTIDRTENQLEVVQPRPLAESNGAIQAPSMESIIAAAVENKTPPESLDRLLAVYERMTKIKAEQAFNAAFSAFRSECPPVQRRSVNAYFMKVNRNGVKVPTMYASIEDIAATVDPFLGKHGLSYRWGDSRIENNILTIPFVLSHIGGHSVSSSGSMPLENNAGCSAQQKYGIAETYAMRRSMARGLGVATCDEDNDANTPPSKPVTENQAANLAHLIEETKSDKQRFLAAFDAESLDTFPADRYAEAIEAFEKKRRATK